MKDRNLFRRVDTIGNIFMSGCATRENITDGVQDKKEKLLVTSNFSFSHSCKSLVRQNAVLCGNGLTERQ